MAMILFPTEKVLLEKRRVELAFGSEKKVLAQKKQGLLVEVKALKKDLCEQNDFFDALEKQHRDLKQFCDRRIGKFNQDVEKGVRDETLRIQGRLTVAKNEAALYKKTLAENEELQNKVRTLGGERSQLLNAKSQNESNCKAAEEATRLITEGYDQLKKRNEELEAEKIELETEVESLSRERDESVKEQELSASQSVKVEVIEPPMPVFDGTITVWQRTLADAKSDEDQTKAKKAALDARLTDVKLQMIKIKQSKNENKGQRSQPPVSLPRQARQASTKTSLNTNSGNEPPQQMLPHPSAAEDPFPALPIRIATKQGPAGRAAPSTMRIIAPSGSQKSGGMSRETNSGMLGDGEDEK